MSLESNMQILKDAGTNKAYVSVHRIVALFEAIKLYQAGAQDIAERYDDVYMKAIDAEARKLMIDAAK